MCNFSVFFPKLILHHLAYPQSLPPICVCRQTFWTSDWNKGHTIKFALSITHKQWYFIWDLLGFAFAVFVSWYQKHVQNQKQHSHFTFFVYVVAECCSGSFAFYLDFVAAKGRLRVVDGTFCPLATSASSLSLGADQGDQAGQQLWLCSHSWETFKGVSLFALKGRDIRKDQHPLMCSPYY